MSVGQSTSPGLERASDRRELTEVLGRVEQLERVPAARYLTQFGTWHQQLPLVFYDAAAAPPGIDVDGYSWVNDASFVGGGYVEGTADAKYFTGMVLLGPKGSIWQITWRAANGPDFGRFTFALASLLYESDLRPSGDPTGKIAPVDGAYGSFTYIDLATTHTYDGYAATDLGEVLVSSSVPFIVGGDEGAPLTDFDTGVTDPMTGFTLMDGGPGWYRFKVYTDGKNASSSGFKVRISNILFTRRADDNAP